MIGYILGKPHSERLQTYLLQVQNTTQLAIVLRVSILIQDVEHPVHERDVQVNLEMTEESPAILCWSIYRRLLGVSS
jgi:hypothetical protein